MSLRAPEAKRAWLPEFAYRCTPLAIANRAGVELAILHDVSFRWNGGWRLEDLEVMPKNEVMVSHFGSGIISFVVPYLFRTPRGWGLWVGGPANDPMDGCGPLEGIVESGWSPMTFTMNWRMTMVDQWVHFRKGQAVARILPVRIAAISRVTLEEKVREDLPARKRREYEVWAKRRDEFLARLKNREPASVQQGWQKTYHKGARHKRLKAAAINTSDA